MSTGRPPRDDKDINRGIVALSQGMPRLPANHQKLGKGKGTDCSSSPQKDPTLPTPWSSRLQMELCHGSPSKIIYSLSKFNGIFSILILINFSLRLVIVAAKSLWHCLLMLQNYSLLTLFCCFFLSSWPSLPPPPKNCQCPQVSV